MVPNAAINILMVEDNTGDQFLLSELLSASDLAIKNLLSAIRLDDALQQLKGSVDIILLDLSLPDSSGIETFNLINKNASKIPIVILSGLTDTRLALEAITLGAQDYLIKGDFDEKLLAKTIRYSIERKRNMEELQASNERYNLVSKATNDMVWDWNVLTGEVYRNVESWNKIFGTSLTELPTTNMFFSDRIHPDDRDATMKKVDEIIGNPNQFIFSVECRVLKENGDYAFVSDLGYILRDDTGKATRVIGATQNITERKEAETILKTSEERYRYLFNNNPASIIIWNLDDFKILEVNESSIEQYGFTKTELLQKTILDLSMPEEHVEIKELAQKAKAGVFFKVTSTWRHQNKMGENMFMEVTSHRIDYKQKNVILALANNVTEKIQLEEKLEEEQLKKQQEITEAVITAQEKEREEIGGELHDNVNQILASARLYLGLAKRDLKEPINFLEQTDNLIFSAIGEIRSLSHSLIPPSLNESELKDALGNLVNMVSTGASLKVHLHLADFDEEKTSDKLKLTIYRIVQEQFNNILKHAKASNIDLTLANPDKRVLLTIKDDGRGFDKSKKTEGVGLMNMRTRASLFNGEMSIQSKPGDGCELKLTFK